MKETLHGTGVRPWECLSGDDMGVTVTEMPSEGPTTIRHRIKGRVTCGPGALVVITGFAISRVYAIVAGVRIETNAIDEAWQLLDVQLLEDAPIESIFLLHSQPPVFNAVTAVFVRLPDVLLEPTLSILWAAMSLVAALALYSGMRAIEIRQSVAAVIVTLFVISPASLLYSSWYFYSEILVFLLSLTLFFLTRFSSTLRSRDLLKLTIALGALVLTRTVYHLLLVIGLLAVFWLVQRIGWQRAYLVAALPLVVAGLWTVKNGIVFGSYTNSSWLGMSLSRPFLVSFDDEEIDQMLDDGVISTIPAGFTTPLTDESEIDPGSFGSPATDEWTKADGGPNFNNSAYIEVSARYRQDVLEAFRRHPDRYLRNQVNSYFLWFEPADHYPELAENRREIETYADLYGSTVLMRFGPEGVEDPLRTTLRSRSDNDVSTPVWQEIQGSISWTMVMLHVLAVGGWVLAFVRGRREGGDRRIAAVATFTFLLLAFLTAAQNALEVGENMRFRYELMPALLLLAALGVEGAVGAVMTRIEAQRERYPMPSDVGAPPAEPSAPA